MLTDGIMQYRKRAIYVAKWLRWVPFVELVGLNGSMATNTATRASDIDFYIVTRPNRLYTARLLAVMVVHLTGWRRYGNRIAGRVCLNRFATRAGLTVTPHNEYHARVFSPLVPLFTQSGIYARYRAANEWMAQAHFPVIPLPNWRNDIGVVPGTIPLPRRLVQWLLHGRLGDWCEEQLSAYQRERILRHSATYDPESRVFIRAHELCLHLAKK